MASLGEIPVHVHVHVDIPELRTVLDELADANQKLEYLKRQGRNIMAKQQEIDDALEELNNATNSAAAVLDDVRSRLTAALADAGVSAGAEDAALMKLAEVSKSLRAMARDPENPVPEPVPDAGTQPS